MTLTGENKHTQRETCSSATLPTTNPTRTGMGWNQGHHSHRPAKKTASAMAQSKLPQPWYSSNSGPPMKHFVPPTGAYCYTPWQPACLSVSIIIITITTTIIIISKKKRENMHSDRCGNTHRQKCRAKGSRK